MSKYIDASLFVEMQIYDEGYEEWSMWNGTIEDLLNQWTDQGCPPAIEVSKDCISRANLIESFLADNECDTREEAKACMCSLDLMLELIADAPSVTPTEKTGGWKIRLSKEDKTLWVKVDSTEILDGFGRVIIEDGEHWCKVFYEDGDATPTERTGEWITEKDSCEIICSECGYEAFSKDGEWFRSDYCPTCGAKMKGGIENE